MEEFTIPTADEVSKADSTAFAELKSAFGKIPNIYAALAKTNNGLENYLNAVYRDSSLSDQERDVVALVVSQVNRCPYCLSFHTEAARRNGFDDAQILLIRSNNITFNEKLDALAKLAHNIAIAKGVILEHILDDFYEAGYQEHHLVDVIITIGGITTLNLLYAATRVPVDWPPAMDRLM